MLPKSPTLWVLSICSLNTEALKEEDCSNTYKPLLSKGNRGYGTTFSAQPVLRTFAVDILLSTPCGVTPPPPILSKCRLGKVFV